jgi:hypothetical protein
MRKNHVVLESILLGIGIAIAVILLLNLTSLKKEESRRNLNSGGIIASSTENFPQQDIPSEELRVNPGSGNIPPAINVKVSREVLCLFTIVFEEDFEHDEYQPDIPLPLTKLFLTLFRTVISPNAP